MIRRSPAEAYIKFLLVHPDKYSVDAVRAIIYKQELDWPHDDYAEDLRKKMRVPRPFFPMDTSHRASSLFLDKEAIRGFFHPDVFAAGAHKLLKNAKAKEVIETMSLVEDPPAFIAHRLRTLGIKCDTTTVKRYCMYYFATANVDTLELNALMHMRIDRVAHPHVGSASTSDQLQYTSLNKCKYKDPRRMVLDMPVAAMASLMNQMRGGVHPSKLELARVAVASRAAASIRVLESVIAGGPNGGALARDYALVTKSMTELITDLGNPDENLRKEMQNLMIRTQDAAVPLMSSLPGERTLDLTPPRIDTVGGDAEDIVEEELEDEVEDEEPNYDSI